jgi:hypothetical protein
MKDIAALNTEVAGLKERIAKGKVVLNTKVLEYEEAKAWHRDLAETHAANATPPVSYKHACEKVAALRVDVEGREQAIKDMEARVVEKLAEIELINKANHIASKYRAARIKFIDTLNNVNEIMPELKSLVEKLNSINGTVENDMKIIHYLNEVKTTVELNAVGLEALIERDEIVMDNRANTIWLQTELNKLNTLDKEIKLGKLKDLAHDIERGIDRIRIASDQFTNDQMRTGIRS